MAVEGRTCAGCGGPLGDGYPPDVSICRACDVTRHTTVVGDRYVDPETGEVHELTPEFFVEGSRWVYARSMPRNPHEYSVRDLVNANARRSTCLSHDTFEYFIRHVREHGVKRRFGGRAYIYLDVGEFTYWTVGFPPEVTTICNRKRIGT